MKLIFSDHAKKRIKERFINSDIIKESLKSPDKIEVSTFDKNRFLVKKVYYHIKFKQKHLLMIVCEKEKDEVVKIITIIDTSKIVKYL